MNYKLITLFLFISLHSFSQIQNEQGKIILETNDTITGSITYLDDFSSTVTYIDSSDNGNSCTIECINEIILNNGARYTTINYGDKEDSKVFVQKIISSDLISLYASEENGAIYYYVSKDNVNYRLENNEVKIVKKTENGIVSYYAFKNNKYYKLESNDKALSKDDKQFTTYDYRYIGILKMLMYDQPELFKQIDKLKLTEPDLIELILEYNQGNINYIMTTSKVKSKSISNWVLFGQYSNYGTYYNSEPTNGYSYGVYAGAQLYFTRSRRHSLKLSLGYSHYDVERTYYVGHATKYDRDLYSKVYNFKFTYEYIFFMTKRTNIFALLHIGDFSYVSEYQYKNDEMTDHYFLPMPTIAPGLGIEYKTLKRLSFYLEINNLLNVSYIPMNLSAGLKYDIGKITRSHISN